MRLIISLPTETVVDQSVRRVAAEGLEGRFTLLPRHVDCVSGLVPGVLSFTPAPDAAGAEDEDQPQPAERFAAIDEGILVKCGDETRISVRNAALGGELGELERIVREQFQEVSEQEEKVRSAAARLEAGFARKFLEWRKSYG